MTTPGAARVFLNEHRFQAIYDSVNDGIFIQDPETGAILDVNRRLCEWFGYSAEHLLTLDLGRMGLGLWPYNAGDGPGVGAQGRRRRAPDLRVAVLRPRAAACSGWK